MTNMIKANQISLILDNKVILNNVNLNWRKGERIALIGENGAGKTTLLKIISTLLKPTMGKLIFPEGISQNEWRKIVGNVFQESFLYDDLTVMENLYFYQKLYGREDKDEINHWLDIVNLTSIKDERCGLLSKGMKQRLSIVRGLLHDPHYLLLDEPFDGLDIESESIIKSILTSKKDSGVGWLLVSHNVREAWNLCDRAILMHQGKIVFESSCEEINYKTFLKYYQSILQR